MSHTVQVNIYTAGEALDLGLVQVGVLAAGLAVSVPQIVAWTNRRSASAFPVAAGFLVRGDSLTPVYDFTAALDWREHRDDDQATEREHTREQ